MVEKHNIQPLNFVSEGKTNPENRVSARQLLVLVYNIALEKV